MYKILCNYDLNLECLHDREVKCVNCSRTDSLPWAIIEYNPTWCPDGQIISLWESEEKAKTIYKWNDLDNHKTSTFKIQKVK